MALTNHVWSTHRDLTGTDVTSYTSGTHTPTGTPDVAFVIFSAQTLSTAPSVVRYGGVDMTLVVSPAVQNLRDLWVYRLDSPPSGAQTAYIQTATSFYRSLVLAIHTLTGSGVTVRTPATANGLSATPSVAATSVAGDYVVGVLAAADDGAVTVAPGASETEVVDQTGVNPRTRLQVQVLTAAGATTTHTWTINKSMDWAAAAYALYEGGAGTTTVGRDAPLAWNVREAAGMDAGGEWAVRAPAGRAAPLEWNVLAAIGRAAAAGWAVLTPVGREASAEWNVLSSRLAVGRDAPAAWAVRSLVGQGAELVWGVDALAAVAVRGTVTARLVTLGSVSASLTFTAAMTGRPSKE